MTEEDETLRLSIELDPDLVDQLAMAQAFCLGFASLIACVVLTAWFVPAVGRLLPAFWVHTKANTTLMVLTSSLSLALARTGLHKRSGRVSQAFAIVVFLVTAAMLLEYLLHTTLRLELLLPHNAALMLPGRASPQTAMSFCLLSIAMYLLRARKTIYAVAADVVVCVLSVFVLVNVSGYIYGAIRLYGLTNQNRTGPFTLLCLALLTFVAFGRRAEQGSFGIMLGRGIGSRVSRIAFPAAALLPFAIEAMRARVVHAGLVHPEYAAALATSAAVVLAFVLILILAWRMHTMEQEILDLSLRDELTQLYNRRGFFLLSEQAMWMAQRSKEAFSMLYVDLDNLKTINDTNGHAVGSEFIRETADLLKQIMRRTDIVGRVGGDEFVIAGRTGDSEIQWIADRLTSAVEERNSLPGRKYPLSLSLGCVTSEANSGETLEELMHRADAAMYEMKRRKKLGRG